MGLLHCVAVESAGSAAACRWLVGAALRSSLEQAHMLGKRFRPTWCVLCFVAFFAALAACWLAVWAWQQSRSP
jgi:hypothetical protein